MSCKAVLYVVLSSLQHGQQPQCIGKSTKSFGNIIEYNGKKYKKQQKYLEVIKRFHIFAA